MTEHGSEPAAAASTPTAHDAAAAPTAGDTTASAPAKAEAAPPAAAAAVASEAADKPAAAPSEQKPQLQQQPSLPRPTPIPTVEQCKVLQAVIKLLETHDDAKRMLPLAAMSPEQLQQTLAHSQQPINVADVLSKLAPNLDPAVAAQMWERFRAGAAHNTAAANGAVVPTPALAAAVLNQAAPLAPGAANPAHAKLKKQVFAANNRKCSVCSETYHPSFSPLLLCDFCPQAHHVFCLGLDWADLPEGEWACPSCLPLPGGPRLAQQQQRVLNMQRDQQLRMKSYQGAAAAAAADRERRKADERAAKELARVKAQEERDKLKADSSKRGARGQYQLDDSDLAMEDAAEAARLASLLPQLQDAADREGTSGRRGSNMASYDSMDETGDGLPPLPPNRRMIGGPMFGAYGGYGMASASEQLREASDRLRRLQATAAGPPPLKDVVNDKRQLHSLMDALAVAEFLATFAAVCGAPNLNLVQLQQAVAWPLDGPELFEVYSSLIKYLLAQWSHIESGHVGARVRRWARCLERSSAVGSFDQTDACCDGLNGHAPNANATWQELLRRYCLLSRSSLRVKSSELKPGQEYATMSDDLIMVHAAVELGKQAAWHLPPEFHLRLLHALSNDVVNCFNMKAEISSRLDTSIALQIEKFHADAEERKKEKEAARMRREAAQAARDKRARELSMSMANTPQDGSTPDPQFTNPDADTDSAAEPPFKRARSSSGAIDTMAGEDGTPGLGGAFEGTPDPAADAAAPVAGWRSGEDREARDAALSAELARYMIRSEPLGYDRNHQRYWHMQSLPSIIFVESSDGDSLGLITNKQQLDTLMAALNKRGTRESALHQVLQKRYTEFCRCLQPPTLPLDVRAVPRNRRARRNWLKQAAKAMPANVPLDATGWPVKQEQPQQLDEQQQQQADKLPDYQQLLAASEETAVAAALSELEGLVSQLVGVGIYDLQVKEWRRRLRGKKTVDELCQMLEEFEAALSRVGDGRPQGATQELVDECIREADIYEAEFVMPVSAAELAEQQEAAAAAAAAAAAEKAAEGGDNDEGDDGEPALLPEVLKPPPSNKKGKRGSSVSTSKKGKSTASKKGGKKGAAAADEDDSTNPDASAHKGPMVTLFSGATRVRKAGYVKQEQQQDIKQEDGSSAANADSVQGDCSAAVKQEEADVTAVKQDEDLMKMVSPLEELDDSDVEAEKRYQEKRAAEKAGEPIPPPPVVLWRSTRELGVWVKDLRRARTTGALGGAAYAAAALVDRAHRLMSNLALSRIRTGVAAAIAYDRDNAYQRKQELLLGPAPWDEGLQPTAEELAKQQQQQQQKENTIVTSTGRRIKGTAEPRERRKMSARQRSKRGVQGSDDEMYYYDEFGEYYGGVEQELEEAYPPPEGKWGLACLACGAGGEVACCEVPGCSVLMHLSCAGMPDADYYYCPEHLLTLQQPWLHSVAPPDKYAQAPAPPVRPNVP